MIELVTTYLRRVYSSFLAHVVDIPPRLLALLLFLLLALFPLYLQDIFILDVLITASALAIFVASWDLLVGFTGQMSLGHALFFGLSGYSSALLFKYFGLPIWITIPVSLVVSVVVAVAISFPVSKLKGAYLSMVMMAFPLIASGLLYIFPEVTGSDSGIRYLPIFFPLDIFKKEGVSGLEAVRQQTIANYWLIFLLMCVSLLVLYKIVHSKTGIVLVSVLDDQLASKASGINVNRYKTLAFAVSAFFAGLAGCINTHLYARADPSLFSLTLSFLPIIVTIMGGIGTIYGPVIGIFIYQILDRIVLGKMIEIPSEYQQVRLLVFICIVIFLVIKWPRGIGKFTTDKLKDLEEARNLDERGPMIWKKYRKKK